MPRISQFYGIKIYMYYRDHAPPHFHAIYGDNEAAVEIDSGTISEGSLPKTARTLVRRWTEEHRDELRENWQRANSGEPLKDIDPLA